MVQRRNGPDFTVKALIKALGRDLDSNIAARARVVRAVHLTHSAFVDKRNDFVGAESVASRDWDTSDSYELH
jgi:hypothetical protein